MHAHDRLGRYGSVRSQHTIYETWHCLRIKTTVSIKRIGAREQCSLPFYSSCINHGWRMFAVAFNHSVMRVIRMVSFINHWGDSGRGDLHSASAARPGALSSRWHISGGPEAGALPPKTTTATAMYHWVTTRRYITATAPQIYDHRWLKSMQ